jgi:hypothetical protein
MVNYPILDPNSVIEFDLKVKAFFRNRISYQELYDYVKDNLPTNFMNQLATSIKQVAT